MFKLTGKIKVIKETIQVTESFSKREFVVTDNDGLYPQDICFQTAQDKCNLLDSLKEGQQVEVSFNLRGREWTSPKGDVKYFNTLDAWRIDPSEITNNESISNGLQKEVDDDLPF